MSLGQNVVFGISGKISFLKNLSGSFGHPESGRFKILQNQFFQNFAKINNNSPKFAPNHQNFSKKKFLPTTPRCTPNKRCARRLWRSGSGSSTSRSGKRGSGRRGGRGLPLALALALGGGARSANPNAGLQIPPPNQTWSPPKTPPFPRWGARRHQTPNRSDPHFVPTPAFGNGKN